jgi:predicted Zn-dependent protease
MSTHPVTESRIADTRFRANDINSKDLTRDSLKFQIMKIKLRVLSEENQPRLMKTLQHELTKAKNHEKTALRYGIALSLLQQRDYDRSYSIIKQLRQDYPKQISLQLLEAEYYLLRYQANTLADEKKRLRQKINFIYSGLQREYPQNYPITAYYAQAMLQTGQADSAKQLLRNYLALQADPDSAELYRLLAQAEWQLGNSYAHMDAMSQYHFWKGDIHAAIRQLTVALENDQLTPLQRQRLGERLTRYQTHATQRQKIFPK